MGLKVNGDELRRQLEIRGLLARDLAELAGLSPASVSHALAGRSISPRTFRAITRALAQTDPAPGAEALLARS